MSEHAEEARRPLSYQALQLDDDQAHPTLYRQAAVALLQTQREEQP